VEKNKADLCASLQRTVVEILMQKLREAVKQTGIKEVAVAGGVSANSAVRHAFEEHAAKYGWTIHLPKLSFTTDNAAMVAIVGQYKLQDKDFCGFDAAPFARVTDKF
jgi:N6-L-threonylcarbamoyladenine synthase